MELITLIHTINKRPKNRSVFLLLYPIGNNCGSDLTVKLNKCMGNIPRINDSLSLRKVRNSAKEIISVGQGTPPIILAKQDVEFANLN